jgi:hypothetical protein
MMNYLKLVEFVPAEKCAILSDKLINFVLKSKNEAKMPNQLANNILLYMKNDSINSTSGLAALLEATMLLEPEKTMELFEHLDIPNLAKQVKQNMSS